MFLKFSKTCLVKFTVLLFKFIEALCLSSAPPIIETLNQIKSHEIKAHFLGDERGKPLQ